MLDLDFAGGRVLLLPGVTLRFVGVELRNVRLTSGVGLDLIEALPGATLALEDAAVFSFACPPSDATVRDLEASARPSETNDSRPQVLGGSGSWCRTNPAVARCYGSVELRDLVVAVPRQQLTANISAGGYAFAVTNSSLVCQQPVTPECGSRYGYDVCVAQQVQALHEQDPTWRQLAAAGGDTASRPPPPSPVAPAPAYGGRHALPSGAVAGIAVAATAAGFLLFAAMAMVAWCIYRRRGGRRGCASWCRDKAKLPPWADEGRSPSPSRGQTMSTPAASLRQHPMPAPSPALTETLPTAPATASAVAVPLDAPGLASPFTTRGRALVPPLPVAAGLTASAITSGPTSASSVARSEGFHSQYGAQPAAVGDVSVDGAPAAPSSARTSGNGLLAWPVGLGSLGFGMGSTARDRPPASTTMSPPPQPSPMLSRLSGLEHADFHSPPLGMIVGGAAPGAVAVAGISIDPRALLGGGSYGKVFRGTWQGRHVAVKVLQYGAELCNAVHNEVLLSQALRHPNLVAALHFVEIGEDGVVHEYGEVDDAQHLTEQDAPNEEDQHEAEPAEPEAGGACTSHATPDTGLHCGVTGASGWADSHGWTAVTTATGEQTSAMLPSVAASGAFGRPPDHPHASVRLRFGSSSALGPRPLQPLAGRARGPQTLYPAGPSAPGGHPAATAAAMADLGPPSAFSPAPGMSAAAGLASVGGPTLPPCPRVPLQFSRVSDSVGLSGGQAVFSGGFLCGGTFMEDDGSGEHDRQDMGTGGFEERGPGSPHMSLAAAASVGVIIGGGTEDSAAHAAAPSTAATGAANSAAVQARRYARGSEAGAVHYGAPAHTGAPILTAQRSEGGRLAISRAASDRAADAAALSKRARSAQLGAVLTAGAGGAGATRVTGNAQELMSSAVLTLTRQLQHNACRRGFVPLVPLTAGSRSMTMPLDYGGGEEEVWSTSDYLQASLGFGGSPAPPQAGAGRPPAPTLTQTLTLGALASHTSGSAAGSALSPGLTTSQGRGLAEREKKHSGRPFTRTNTTGGMGPPAWSWNPLRHPDSAASTAAALLDAGQPMARAGAVRRQTTTGLLGSSAAAASPSPLLSGRRSCAGPVGPEPERRYLARMPSALQPTSPAGGPMSRALAPAGSPTAPQLGGPLAAPAAAERSSPAPGLLPARPPSVTPSLSIARSGLASPAMRDPGGAMASGAAASDVLWLAAHTHPAEGCSHGFLVMELCEGGSVDAWRRSRWRESGQVPDMGVLLALAKDIARGMAFIHEHGVCHGDLKLSNCLLSEADRTGPISLASSMDRAAALAAAVGVRWRSGADSSTATPPTDLAASAGSMQATPGPNFSPTVPTAAAARALPFWRIAADGSLQPRWRVKVCDLGLARVLGTDATHVSTRPHGTASHLAPEVWAEGHVSQQSDVYAFGITLWELVTGDRPWRGLTAGRILHAVMLRAARPPLPEWLPPAFASIIHAAWDQDPRRRPSIAQLLSQLQAAAAAVSDGTQHAVPPAAEASAAAASLLSRAALIRAPAPSGGGNAQACGKIR
ncbi:hypothetical protein HYH03_003683 [Edaphochlamys debaryana]|uniref:Protein kinase domain-containing protein n=1 Tax=Edaphochlamys debaryana TaxID=47281 RepID=A0A835YGT6_9CHLO|nr:hypothetical protein HYH03_003683 [Edaphochlamys debaryana]|eukprot:KAG2498425.1 hypothetical protein HYH03_003683 [Edaphochlamys debaryana]